MSEAIPSAFTPNGDNQNDKWEIKGIENCPKAKVLIFNRAGIKIFESIGYKTPFDGTFENTQLGVGVYYYVINFGSECKQINGSLMLIR
ncbi:gliding motility-associated C-terminal domain-containing protein [uncultured Pedobacter sp.]|uniref:gliding motility-associated C-terminal domain-containing protein n=1 Tax=uncultured Pedobacter sp. TaxID=246139 RepID=UPI0025FE11FB|nr:gliding motility-associated C-terminal domain-containing protein [uncultured Pedobacter sp.]